MEFTIKHWEEQPDEHGKMIDYFRSIAPQVVMDYFFDMSHPLDIETLLLYTDYQDLKKRRSLLQPYIDNNHQPLPGQDPLRTGMAIGILYIQYTELKRLEDNKDDDYHWGPVPTG